MRSITKRPGVEAAAMGFELGYHLHRTDLRGAGDTSAWDHALEKFSS